MASGPLPPIEKLKGLDDYCDWKFAMQAYLEIEDLWGCVLGTASYVADTTKMSRCKGKLILSVTPANYSHIRDANTPKDIWSSLNKAYEDSGLTRKVSLLRILTTTKLHDCSSTEDYVNKIFSSAQKLSSLNFKVADEWIAMILLAGLPDEYKPMIMTLESSENTLKAENVKTRILQDVKYGSDSSYAQQDSAFISRGYKNPRFKQNRREKERCYNCNKYGHYARDCDKPDKRTSRSNMCCERNNNHIVESDSAHSNNESETAAFAWMVAVNNNKDNYWYLDSCASNHMSPDKTCFSSLVHIPDGRIVTDATGNKVKAFWKGNVKLKTLVGNKVHQINVQALYIPDLTSNLISTCKLTDLGFFVNQHQHGCNIIHTKSKQIMARGERINDVLRLVTAPDKVCVAASIVESPDNVPSSIWHKRLGHLNRRDMLKLNGLVSGYVVKNCDKEPCEICCKGKQTRLPFSSKVHKQREVLELVHTDLCGPMETPSIGGAKYFLTLTDDRSRHTTVYFLKYKSEAKDYITKYIKESENQLNTKIKIVRSDNGKEYINKDLQQFFSERGIVHQTSCAHTPEQNGLAERKNRTIVEKAKCMMFDANLPDKFWAEAVHTAVHIMNRSPTVALSNTTPLEVWSGTKPSIKHLRVFGCIAMVHIPKVDRRKLGEKSEKLMMVGYSDTQKGYRLINPTTYKVKVSRDITFIESQMFFYSKEKTIGTKPRFFKSIRTLD